MVEVAGPVTAAENFFELVKSCGRERSQTYSLPWRFLGARALRIFSPAVRRLGTFLAYGLQQESCRDTLVRCGAFLIAIKLSFCLVHTSSHVNTCTYL